MRIWFLAFAAILGMGLALLFLKGSAAESISLNMSVKVSDHFGLNADNDALRFGMLMPKTSSQRILEVQNHHSFPVEVTILSEGDMEGWVVASDNGFLLRGGEGKNITFTANVPDAPFGIYNGTAIIRLKRVWLS